MAVIGVIQDNLYKSRANIAIKRIKKKCSGLPVMIHQVSEIRGYNSTYALLNAVVIRDADIVVVELDRLNDIRLKYPDISENISIAAVLKAGNPGNVLITRKFEKKFGHAVALCDSIQAVRQLESIFDGIVCKYNDDDTVKQIIIDSIKKKAQDMLSLSSLISNICKNAEVPVILMIDEVDQASDHKVFIDFLGMLRSKFLKRSTRPTFQSVILAGVYDIKNLKHRIREDHEHQMNSPWNIAADFSVDMSFTRDDIASMLDEYEKDYKCTMEVKKIAELIYEYTSGYPYLVSKICKLIDERCDQNWTKQGVLEAIKILLKETNTLFDDLRKKITDYKELKNMLYSILFQGESYPYNPDNFVIDIGTMFGFIKENDGQVVISNRIFETRLYNLFLSEELTSSVIYQTGERDKNQFVKDGILNMELVLEKFMIHFHDIYGKNTEKFVEENGRRVFLLYLKPIINGTGNYYIEAQTRDQSRTDVIVDYLGKQYVIELKIWRGNEYNKRGEKQLAEYLEYYHLEKGYLLSFNFNKNKKIGLKEVEVDNKKIIEVVV